MPSPPLIVVRHVPHEDLGLLAELFGAAKLRVEYRDAFAGPLGRFDPAAAAGLVVLGGPMNVDETDRYPFLATEVGWIGQALAHETPVLGICLGAQLIAKAAGTRVYPNAVKEIGWYEVEWLETARDDALFHDCRPTETVFQWHGDTFDLPPGAVQLARSRQCAQQAFRVGSCAWALQFHIELTPALLDAWLTEPSMCGEVCLLPYISTDEIRRRAGDEFPRMATLCRRTLARFVELCRTRAAA